MKTEVILYYNFTPVKDPEQFCKEHKEFLKDAGLKGRVYISSEGINGTLGGSPEQIAAYKNYLLNLDGFEETEFKSEEDESVPFAKLICKVREEIVAIGVDKLDPKEGGNYLSPADWRRVMESGDDYVMIDVRNNYESRVGHFEGALKPDVENFYDFPGWLEDAGIPKDKKVLMYCTGGIRCEKFSVLMKKKGWDDVNQLHGGILTYAKEEGGEHFKGKCFVFDDRLVVPVNRGDLQPIARCDITGKPADSYINCANMECNKLFVCSEEGAKIMEGCCSEECKSSEYKRPFDPENAFRPFRKWYNYFDDDFKQRELQNL
ncbi:MAG: rhodanese-related sulfurtransferase [Balneolaceae bacterium]|nr:MAG: rhodanese-related sulfurtransferase [Balneolaceae bacterium]